MRAHWSLHANPFSTLGGPSKRVGPCTCMELGTVWMSINQTDMQNSWNQCKKRRTDLESDRKGREAWDSRTWASGRDAEVELRVYLLPSHLEWPPTPFLLCGRDAAPPAQPLCHLAASPSEWDLRRFWCFPVAYTPAWLRTRHPSSPFLHTIKQMSAFVPACECTFTWQRVSSSLQCARKWGEELKTHTKLNCSHSCVPWRMLHGVLKGHQGERWNHYLKRAGHYHGPFNREWEDSNKSEMKSLLEEGRPLPRSIQPRVRRLKQEWDEIITWRGKATTMVHSTESEKTQTGTGRLRVRWRIDYMDILI